MADEQPSSAVEETTEDEDLAALLYRRTAPITSAIVITVDLPDSDLAEVR